MKNITLFIALLTLSATMSAFAQFSKFVCISPDNPGSDTRIHPEITFTGVKQDYVSVEVSSMQGWRQSWLIVCKEPVSAERQNFRAMVQTMKGGSLPPREKRKEVVLIAPLTAYRGDPSDEGVSTNAINIKIELALELAERAYIYIDYPYCIMDGGYFWSIDIPAFVKRMKTNPNQLPVDKPRKLGDPQHER